MHILTVTARGQVTFRKDLQQHLGIKPGDKIELSLMPDGRAELKRAEASGSFQAIHGMLKGRTSGARLSIEQINDAIADGAAQADAGSQ